MAHVHTWSINPGWRILLTDAGLNPTNVLRRAGLPDDLFGRAKATLSTAEYFQLWQGMEEEAADPLLPLRLGSAISVEAFDPAIFAALCSPDLNTALARISRYKKLVCPLALHVEVGPTETTLEVEWLDTMAKPPVVMLSVELVFFVELARLATRHRVCPLKLAAPILPTSARDYTEYFGVEVAEGPRVTISFHAEDATRPFLTANEAMWEHFEPELQRRLAKLDEAATVSERVQAALLELLPSGDASMGAVSKRLGASSRTLQRRLKHEGESFQALLNGTREKLARHYLKTPNMTGAEISFMLGFEDPNSFFRAFHSWTGQTPEQARSSMLGAH